MGNRLYVGNLSFQSTGDGIKQYFSQAGQVTNVELISDKFTGRSRGFAFVEMGTDSDAQKAIESFHGKDFEGRTITVNEARPRTEHPPTDRRGGGGGGGRGGDRRHSYR